MPWQIRTNWPEGWATTRFHGRVTTEEVMEARGALAADPDRVPDSRMVIDFEQAAELDLTPAQVRRLAALWSDDPSRPAGREWKLGLVASSPVQFGLFRMFEQLRTPVPDQIRVFGDRAEALAWADIDETATRNTMTSETLHSEPTNSEPRNSEPRKDEAMQVGAVNDETGENETVENETVENETVEDATVEDATVENEPSNGKTARRETATLGGGCFWCLEAVFDGVDGVLTVQSGYAGGHAPNPSYRQVCSGGTGHAEVVQVVFDPARIDYEELLRIFFTIHDPTTPNRQGADVGHHYRSIILVHSAAQHDTARRVMAAVEAEGTWSAPLVTEVVPLEHFHPAEAEHDRYFERNPGAAYCRFVVEPKVARARAAFAHRFTS